LVWFTILDEFGYIDKIHEATRRCIAESTPKAIHQTSERAIGRRSMFRQKAEIEVPAEMAFIGKNPGSGTLVCVSMPITPVVVVNTVELNKVR
jgi:hypothetical protein